MINNDAFSKRLKKILEYYQLSASAFAEKIQVQRSSISHLLSGRNKPSLDFVLKVLEEFKDVEMYWLLKGKGSFPKKQKKEDFPTTLFSENPNPTKKTYEKKAIQDELQVKSEDQEYIITPTHRTNTRDVDKIVIFYKDGTFQYYTEA